MDIKIAFANYKNAANDLVDAICNKENLSNSDGIALVCIQRTGDVVMSLLKEDIKEEKNEC